MCTLYSRHFMSICTLSVHCIVLFIKYRRLELTVNRKMFVLLYSILKCCNHFKLAVKWVENFGCIVKDSWMVFPLLHKFNFNPDPDTLFANSYPDPTQVKHVFGFLTRIYFGSRSFKANWNLMNPEPIERWFMQCITLFQCNVQYMSSLAYLLAEGPCPIWLPSSSSNIESIVYIQYCVHYRGSRFSQIKNRHIEAIANGMHKPNLLI